MRTVPEFGKELKRPFTVAEQCYDCGELYDRCNAWPASKPWRCADYLRLPDVLPGTCGQVFLPSRMDDRNEPRQIGGGLRPGPIERQAPRRSAPANPAPEPTSPKPQSEVKPKNGPNERPAPPAKPAARICGCGAPLPKGKRLCDACRIESRRQTKREYMRSYMEQRRSPTSGSDSGVPFTPESTHATCPGGGDLRAGGQWEGGAGLDQTSVLTEGVP